MGMMDYWRMLRAKGPRTPVMYFFQSHLFDLLNGTDTHTWLPKERFVDHPEHFEHGVLYMCSWTSEIKRVFRTLRGGLGEDFSTYAFLDVGCGKGKAVLVWTRELRRNGLKQNVAGIDYYRPFIETARRNHRQLFGSDGGFFVGDATQIDFAVYGERVIVYLYNPFDAVILNAMLDRLAGRDCVIVYNNPVHHRVIAERGFSLVDARTGFHPNAQTMIFASAPVATRWRP
ncbi:class I SAM-dependent methyltransferase [Paludibacterium paludis]|uniref:Methyltransferase domain-containing protein n=1 Tax=Paludibacterium paludis TaxID=1225769 RepID=A0A918P6T6_9NEIS|nr:class I SAM-dependent methyltransferase [Paludibacterium paludis]GGY27970.1 hypothetical protein GCM10011289_34150 [Paludibacterium paludis]